MSKIIKCKTTNEIVYSYSEYLKTKHWQKKRKGLACTTSKKCMLCGTKDRVEVHHLTYKRLGNEYYTDLCFLCRDCHQATHDGGSEALSKVWTIRKEQRREDIRRIKGKDKVVVPKKKKKKKKEKSKNLLPSNESLFMEKEWYRERMRGAK